MARPDQAEIMTSGVRSRKIRSHGSNAAKECTGVNYARLQLREVGEQQQKDEQNCQHRAQEGRNGR